MISRFDFVLQSKHGRDFSGDVRFVEDGKLKSVILFVHGFKGFKDALHFNALADRFAENGFVMAKMNMSHNGTDPDHPMEFVDLEAFSNNNFTIELDDIDVVLDYIESEKFPIKAEEIDKSEIYLMGHSRGGGICILKACEDSRIKKLVTWAAVTDIEKLWGKDVLEEWKKLKTYYISNMRTGQQMPLNYQIIEDFESSGDRFKIPKQVRKLKIPYLAIHGDADETVELDSLKVLTKANSKIKTHIIPNATHTFGGKHPWEDEDLPLESEELLNASVDFLKA
ncbi:MAG: alpha/beta hydrolase [Reichenbachiella sp.]